MADGQSTYDINIRTAADLRAAEAYKRSIEAAAKAAKDAGLQNTELQKRLEGVDKALNSNAARAIKLQENLKKARDEAKLLGADTKALDAQLKASGGGVSMLSVLGGGVSGLFKGAIGQLAAFTGVALGTAAAFRHVGAAIKDYSESEDALVAMQLALAAQGKFSKEAAEGIAELAGQFEKQTNIGDTTWLAQFTRLIQYGGRTENIQQLGTTLKNLAGIMGGDVEGAASVMIRALNGNYRGFEQLGLIVDKNKSDLENWTSLVKQAERGAGILEKQTQTLSGTWKGAGIALGNFEKSLSQTTLGWISMRAVGVGAQQAFQYLADKIGFTIPKVDGLKNASSVLTRSLQEGESATQSHADKLKAMGDAADRTAKKIDQVKNAIKQMQGLDDDEATAKMNFELALVDDEEKRTGNALGAARKRVRIHSRYGAEKARRANESDVAQLAIENQRAGQIISRQNYLQGAVAYYDRTGDKSKATQARQDLTDFNQTLAPQLDSLRVSSTERFAAMKSRNRVYSFESATAAVQANTTERGIREQLAQQALSNLEGGRGAGVFKELAQQSNYIPGAIDTAANVSKLLGELVRVYGVTSSQVQELRQTVNDINSRARKGREMN
jgi:hypothetical protein